MDIRQIRTFVTVARLGSITKAAEALHVTQPAASGQIKSLEEDLSMRLFARTTTSLALTQAGQELLPKAERILEVFADFRNRAKVLSGQVAGKLRIGVAMLDPERMRMGDFMRTMVTAYPALQMELQVNRISWLLEALRLGDIDGAIFVGRNAPPEAEGLVLTELAFRLVAPAAWKTRLQGASWSDAALMPWIRTSRPSAHHEMLTDIFREAAIKPVEVVEADHELLIRSLVAAGVGIGLIREDLALEAQASGELMIFSDYRAMTRLIFIYSELRKGDPTIAAAIGALKTVWGIEEVVAAPRR